MQTRSVFVPVRTVAEVAFIDKFLDSIFLEDFGRDVMGGPASAFVPLPSLVGVDGIAGVVRFVPGHANQLLLLRDRIALVDGLRPFRRK